MITPTTVLFAASFIVAIAAAVIWRRRGVPGGKALTLMYLAVVLWCFFSALETIAVDDGQRYLLAAFNYLGICSVAPFFFIFAVRYSNSRWRLSAWVLILIWSVPAASLLVAFTNDYHHLLWTGISHVMARGVTVDVWHHGPWYLVATLWSLALCILASYHMLRVAIRAARLYVLQAVLIMAGLLVPWAGYLLFFLPNNPLVGYETTCLGFVVSALLIMTAILRFRFLDLVPQARATLIENMREGFLVLDVMDRIVDSNRSARELCGMEGTTVGDSLHEVFPALGRRLGVSRGKEIFLVNPLGVSDQTLEVSVSPLVNHADERTGRLLLIRDISERWRAESEREELIGELREALANVRNLSGLLPICASCKKIRNDQGYWQGVENYMREHADVKFSHGLCPECAAKAFAELTNTSGWSQG